MMFDHEDGEIVETERLKRSFIIPQHSYTKKLLDAVYRGKV